MTRYYVCTLTLAVPDDGPPAITASSWRLAARHEPGTPETEPTSLSEKQRDYLLDLAGRKEALDQYELLIRAATTAAEGKELRDQLSALPDPVAIPAQRRGA